MTNMTIPAVASRMASQVGMGLIRSMMTTATNRANPAIVNLLNAFRLLSVRLTFLPARRGIYFYFVSSFSSRSRMRRNSLTAFSPASRTPLPQA